MGSSPRLRSSRASTHRRLLRDRHARASRRAATTRRGRSDARRTQASPGSSPSARRSTGCRTALELADRHDGVFAILGIHPHEAGTADEAAVGELAALLAHPRAVAVGETGLDCYRDYAPRDRQRWLFEAELELAAEHRQAGRRSTRAPPTTDTLACWPASTATVVLHCFSSSATPAGRARAGVLRLLRRERHLPEGPGAADRSCRDPGRPDPRRDRQPVPRAAAGARPPERAGKRHAHARRARRGAR